MPKRKVLPGDPDPFEPGRRRVEEALKKATAANSKLVQGIALVLERQIKLQLSIPPERTGREYPRGRKKHRASAPGESPAPDTGVTRGSIGHETVGGVIRVGSGQKHAPFLEFGTPTMQPRPFMRPAYNTAKKDMTEFVVGKLRGEPPL
jgi:HK97 gp10 family phage protein